MIHFSHISKSNVLTTMSFSCDKTMAIYPSGLTKPCAGGHQSFITVLTESLARVMQCDTGNVFNAFASLACGNVKNKGSTDFGLTFNEFRVIRDLAAFWSSLVRVHGRAESFGKTSVFSYCNCNTGVSFSWVHESTVVFNEII